MNDYILIGVLIVTFTLTMGLTIYNCIKERK